MSAPEQAFPVLVVDDSPVARKLVERALPPDRYSILTAVTGQEALTLFAKHRPGLVITDWLMPDLSGIELCQRLRADFHDCFTYVILLTGVSEKSKIVAGLHAGADEYLTKPFHPEELLARAEVGQRIVGLHRELEDKNRLLEQLALTDPLTGLPNRRAIEQWGTRQLSGAIRHDFHLCVVEADLDQFKAINDTYGHDAGDEVLKRFGEILKINTRQCDIGGRIGGDEFLLVVTYVDQAGIQIALERIRVQLQGSHFTFGGRDVTVTASFGIAEYRRGQATDFNRLMVQADVALYSAKRLGRNRVEAIPAEIR
ncbi:MAG: GGDEF domain-containing response regulator [Candidatus Acidiferrales bacterium]